DVRQVGVTVDKQTSGFLMIVSLISSEPAYDINYLGNYANSELRDRLLRLDGVGGVLVFGGGNYAMRVWIDPARAAAHQLNAGDIVAALRTQNIQVSGGSLGEPPFSNSDTAFQLPVQAQGRLSTPQQFGEVIIRTDDAGRITRLRDVARIELGSQDYNLRGYFGPESSQGIALAVIQQPGANALDAAELVLNEIEAASAGFPAGVEYLIPYNPTEYVAASVETVQVTLLEAVVLVVIVVVVFLQTWRAALIPIVAIPTAIIGTFAVQLALGYSINSLSLFALVLAVGIVVDDAIVVVENVERNIRAGMTPRLAAHRTMDEVSSALIAISLVLVAVFVPTAFVTGIPGIFFRQFAVAIAAATVISLVVSLTLSPALAAMLLKPHVENAHRKGSLLLRPLRLAAHGFNSGFEWISDRYGRLTGRLIRAVLVMMVLYIGLLGLTGWRLTETPTGFIPEQDQGYLIGVVQLPPGSTLDRTDAVMQRAGAMALETPGVAELALIAGLDGASFSAQPNAGTFFIRLIDHAERADDPSLSADALAGALSMQIGGAIEDANVFIIKPPSVPGLGNGSGFTMMIQDRSGAGYPALQQATYGMMFAAAEVPQVNQVFTLFNTGSPRIEADIDRVKAQLLGVAPEDIYQTLAIYLGSAYVNDFNYLGRSFRVVAQAEPDARDDLSDIGNLRVRSATGGMVPLSSVANLSFGSGPSRVVRFNMFPAAELQGSAAPGVATGDALAAMEALAAQVLPAGFDAQWTDLAYQQKAAGDSGSIIFIMAVLLVLLVLAAQYESLTLPLAVIMIVPMCILAAMIGVNLMGSDNNILTQVGLVVLIGLAAKNAILIVEFAKQAEDQKGMDRFAAAVDAARTRLRPILMTSFAFSLGVLPLVLSVGPGAEMRQALGTATFFGMIGVTVFGLIFTPVFYVMMRRLARKRVDELEGPEVGHQGPSEPPAVEPGRVMPLSGGPLPGSLAAQTPEKD
ncbi:MAG: efflux RND transporter permease subunit, partial [Alphaproteobacteria bacterium]